MAIWVWQSGLGLRLLLLTVQLWEVGLSLNLFLLNWSQTLRLSLLWLAIFLCQYFHLLQNRSAQKQPTTQDSTAQCTARYYKNKVTWHKNVVTQQENLVTWHNQQVSTFWSKHYSNLIWRRKTNFFSKGESGDVFCFSWVFPPNYVFPDTKPIFLYLSMQLAIFQTLYFSMDEVTAACRGTTTKEILAKLLVTHWQLPSSTIKLLGATFILYTPFFLH